MSTVVDEIPMPARPDDPGLHFRRFRGPGDYPGLASANQALRDRAGIEEVATAASMAVHYDHLVNCDPAMDMVVVERAGSIVAYARVEWRDQVDGTRSLATICAIHPAEWGRGIGTSLLTWQEDRLRAIAGALPDAATKPARLVASTWGGDERATALLTTSGWTQVARGYEMVRPTLDAIPDLPMADGLEIRPVDRSDQRRIWEAAVEAFRDHRDEPEPDEADIQAWIDDPRADPSLWFVAFDGHEIAGSVLGLIDAEENAHHGRERGLIAEVSTRRPWRRRGVAKALICRTLVALQARGMTSAYLGVDGANPNQAMDLYESIGFEIVSTGLDWSKPL